MLVSGACRVAVCRRRVAGKSDLQSLVPKTSIALTGYQEGAATAGAAAPAAKRSREATTRSFTLRTQSANTIKAQFHWCCCRTDQVTIKKPYLTGRAPGFAKDEDHFDTLTNTLGAAGLIKDTMRGGSSGSFSFLRPLASDDLTHVIAQFTAWLEIAKQKFAKKMETAETNGDFNRAEFDIVMASLKGDARVQVDNR